MGNVGRTEAGDVQVMSAGTGVRHSEYNAESVTTKIFQIWITPDASGMQPAWGARPFPKADRAGSFVTLASGMLGDGHALKINSDARVAGATIKAGETVSYPVGPGRRVYLVPATGKVEVNGIMVDARDGVAVNEEQDLSLTALEDSEIVLVETA
jgi:redox-sensitive bicupin YhaK (pirin superfamily)